MREQLHKLVAHMRWADRQTLAALQSASSAAREGTGDAALIERALSIYAHVLGAEHVWLTRLEGQPATVAVWPVMTSGECEALAAENASAFERFIETMPAEDLAGMTSYTNTAGVSFTSRVDDILLQVLMHGSYHRGQIAMLLRDAGAVPNATDYIAFVRGEAAAARIDAQAIQPVNGPTR